jgi:hypothetical protein
MTPLYYREWKLPSRVSSLWPIKPHRLKKCPVACLPALRVYRKPCRELRLSCSLKASPDILRASTSIAAVMRRLSGACIRAHSSPGSTAEVIPAAEQLARNRRREVDVRLVLIS